MAFDFCEILRVRNEIDSPRIETQFLKSLRRFRQIHEAAKKNPDLLFNNYIDLWRYLSTDHGGSIALPPLYQDNNILLGILRNFTMQMLRRDQLKETLQTGNMILGGVEGAGKTTLAKAMVLAVAVCSKRFYLMYFDFKNAKISQPPTTEVLCKELLNRLLFKNFEGEFGSLVLRPDIQAMCWSNCLQVLHDKFGCVGLVADGLQNIISICKSEEEFVVRREVMRSFETFGRNYRRTFLVMTGSSSNFRSRLYAQDRSPEFDGYPDFNRSLCDYYHVPALRDLASLASYLKVRYPGSDFSDERVGELLYVTGGIGRLVHASVPISLSEYSIPIEELFLSEYMGGECCSLRVIVALIRRDNPAVVTALEKYWAGTGPLILNSCFGSSLTAVLEALSSFRVKNPRGIVDKMIDKGFLYMKTEKGINEVQLSLPVLARRSSTDDSTPAVVLPGVLAYKTFLLHGDGWFRSVVVEEGEGSPKRLLPPLAGGASTNVCTIM